MYSSFVLLVAALAVLGGMPVGDAVAAEQQILGKQLLVRDPTGEESKRRVVMIAQESATDIAALVGNPAADGAMLVFGRSMCPAARYPGQLL
jgi:hypothetical protein